MADLPWPYRVQLHLKGEHIREWYCSYVSARVYVSLIVCIFVLLRERSSAWKESVCLCVHECGRVLIQARVWEIPNSNGWLAGTIRNNGGVIRAHLTRSLCMQRAFKCQYTCLLRVLAHAVCMVGTKITNANGWLASTIRNNSEIFAHRTRYLTQLNQMQVNTPEKSD